MKFDRKKYPFCFDGHQYALDVLGYKIIANVYIQAVCKRYLEDFNRTDIYFDKDAAERFLRLAQKFKHVKGKDWKTENITFEPWQNFMFMNIYGWYLYRTKNRRYRAAYCEVARGNGKALCLETMIPTPNGLKKFGDIQIGDEVLGRNGVPTKVIAQTEIHYPSKQYILNVDSVEIVASGEHLWISTNSLDRKKYGKKKTRDIGVKRFQYEKIRNTEDMAKEVQRKGETNYTLPLPKQIEGVESNFTIDPYTVGYWIGNGSKNSGRITCANKDVLDVTNRISLAYNTKIYPDKGRESSTVRIVGLTVLLKEEGLLGAKLLSNKCLMLPLASRLDLLRGLLDSDGYINKQGQVEFTTIYLELAKQTVFLISSFGFKAQIIKKAISENNNFKSSTGYVYRVMFTPRTSTPLFYIKRKAGRQISKKGTHSYTKARYVKAISPLKEIRPMKCITVDNKDGSFLITEHCIVTHNSALASIAGLYHLALEDPKGNEVYSAATGRDQARIILDSARAMAKANPSFLTNTGTQVLAHKIIHESSNSEFKALSSDSNTLDGLQPACALIDELHAHKSRHVYDVIDSAMSKRRDSLLFIITTAGFSTVGIGYSESSYSKKVALGEVKEDSRFCLIYTLDEKDDWTDRNVWIKANPNLGVSVDPLNFKAKVEKAKANPADKINFQVKHLNLWTNSATPFFNIVKWDTCQNKGTRLEEFKGEKCWAALDLASKIDLTSIAYIFQDAGLYYIFDKSFLPERALKESKNVAYNNWVDSGDLLCTQGEAINYPKIQEIIIEDSKIFKFQWFAFDPWSCTEAAQRLIQQRIDMIEFRMTTANLSEPMKRLDALILEEKIRHNGSPLLRWCLGNVVAKYDANDNVFPRKEDERLKIDPIISIIMALAGIMNFDQKQSIYEERGILVL